MAPWGVTVLYSNVPDKNVAGSDLFPYMWLFLDSLLEVVPNLDLVGKQCNTHAQERPYNVLPFQFIKMSAQVIARDEM